ncbi:MAG: diguanylate cyclase [candidate division WOR-3 bacterium]
MPEGFLHDPLTNVYHRNYLFFRLNEEILRAKRKGSPLCIFFIDLDFFKMINDNLGHQVGDEVLKQFSENLKISLRESDLIFRYGGDEFVILLPEMLLDDALKIAQRLKEQIESAGYGPSKNLRLSISIGISQFPIDGLTAEELLKAADERTLLSKKSGRGKIITRSEMQTELPSLTLSDLRIVGRDRELHTFSRLLSDFKNDNKRFITIIRGLRGVGITRLINEISKIAQLLDLNFIKVTIQEKDSWSPSPIYKAMLRELITPEIFERLDEDKKSVVATLLPNIGYKSKDTTVTINEMKLYHIVKEIFSEYLPNSLVLAIDNGHLLQQKCIKTLANLIKDESTRKISFIISKRSKNLLEEVLKSAHGELYFFDIAPLNREEVKTILWQLLRNEPHDEFVDWVMSKTGGRPLYIDKLLNALLISRKIIPSEDRYIITDSYYIETDNFLLPLVEELSNLNPLEKEILSFCAVYNIDFSTSIISAITEYPVNQILEILDNLVKNGYIEEIIPYNLYRFTNPFVREIIIAEIPKEKRVSMHYKIVRALESNPEESSRLNPQILYEHYIECGMENKAIPYLELIIKNEIKKRNYRKALNYIRRIFSVAEHKLTIVEKISLLRNWALCLRYEGEYEESLLKLNQAMELAKKFSEKYQEALLRLDLAWIQHEIQKASELLLNVQEIEKLANELGDKDILSNALIYKALYYLDFQKNITKAVLILEEIPPLQKEEENHEILAKTYANLGKCYMQLKKYQKAKECYELAIYHAKFTDRADYLAATMMNYATLQYAIQDLESARITHEKALEIIRRENLRNLLHHSYFNLAMIYVNYGEYTLAINYLERAIDNTAEIGLVNDELAFRAILHGVKAYLGDYRYNAEKLEEIVSKATSENIPYAFERATSYLIPIYSMLGDIENLKKTANRVTKFKNLRSKKIAESALLEAMVVFSENPNEYTDLISSRLKESIDSSDLLTELSLSTSLYMIKLITNEDVKVNFEQLLQRAKGSHLLKQYIDIILAELILGRFSIRYLEEMQNNETKMNLKQKILLKIAEIRNSILSVDLETAEAKTSKVLEIINHSENKYCEVLLYRMLIKEFAGSNPTVVNECQRKLSNLTISSLKELVLP